MVATRDRLTGAPGAEAAGVQHRSAGLAWTGVARARPGISWEVLAGWPGATLVLLVALGARFVGLDYGLPHSFYADEDKVASATHAIASSGDLRPIHFFYPAFWLYVLALALKLGVDLASLVGGSTPFGPATLDQPAYVYGMLRAVTATVGALSTVALYLLGRSLFTALRLPGAGGYALASAGFLALSPLHVQHSHVASPDVPTTAFLIIAAYFT
ncbi:MAG: hypothetical protein M3088_00790, partial [Actinomycetota bacterium]|nr:hypothetical protein [Actinomycetota bacterium]